MAEEFTTRDIFEQVDRRLTTVEQDVRSLRSEVKEEFRQVRSETKAEFSHIRAEMSEGFRSLRADGRWLVGIVFASWLTVMASIWLKP